MPLLKSPFSRSRKQKTYSIALPVTEVQSMNSNMELLLQSNLLLTGKVKKGEYSLSKREVEFKNKKYSIYDVKFDKNVAERINDYILDILSNSVIDLLPSVSDISSFEEISNQHNSFEMKEIIRNAVQKENESRRKKVSGKASGFMEFIDDAPAQKIYSAEYRELAAEISHEIKVSEEVILEALYAQFNGKPLYQLTDNISPVNFDKFYKKLSSTSKISSSDIKNAQDLVAATIAIEIDKIDNLNRDASQAAKKIDQLLKGKQNKLSLSQKDIEPIATKVVYGIQEQYCKQAWDQEKKKSTTSIGKFLRKIRNSFSKETVKTTDLEFGRSYTTTNKNNRVTISNDQLQSENFPEIYNNFISNLTFHKSTNKYNPFSRKKVRNDITLIAITELAAEWDKYILSFDKDKRSKIIQADITDLESCKEFLCPKLTIGMQKFYNEKFRKYPKEVDAAVEIVTAMACCQLESFKLQKKIEQNNAEASCRAIAEIEIPEPEYVSLPKASSPKLPSQRSSLSIESGEDMTRSESPLLAERSIIKPARHDPPSKRSSYTETVKRLSSGEFHSRIRPASAMYSGGRLQRE